MVWAALPGWTKEDIAAIPEKRLHVQLSGRFVTVLVHQDKLYAIDSPCFHACGPLGDGPVKDIEDIPCIECPWHRFLVSLETGEFLTREIQAPPVDENGVYRSPGQLTDLRPDVPGQPYPDNWLGPPKPSGVMQRVHTVEEREDGQIWVDMYDGSQIFQVAAKHPLKSDRPAFDQQRGKLCIKLAMDREAEEGNEKDSNGNSNSNSSPAGEEGKKSRSADDSGGDPGAASQL